MLKLRGFLLVTAACVLLAAPATGQEPDPEPPSDALLEDASWYAADVGVSLDEAVRRLRLQRVAGELAGDLRTDEAGSFAGLWIEHEPEWRVVARFTDPFGAERLAGRVADTPLEGLVEVIPAAVSLAELEERQATTHHLARNLRFPVNSEVNVFENRVEVYTTHPAALRGALAAARVELPERVALVQVPRLAQPDVLRGGEHGSTCTGGFTVSRFDGDLGISTAAHCGNSQAFQGESLPFRTEDLEGNQDVQWHSACDILDVSNEFNTGIGDRACTGTQHRNDQAIGSFVCKYGMTTQRTCGTIQTKSYSISYVNNSASTFVRVDGGSTNLSSDGDSGGPWFVEHLAYGIHSGAPGGDANDSLYMPINYISSLGVSVLTSDPGPGCNLHPDATFTWTRSGNWVAFDASGSSDPDGSIVSYSWDFGDGTGTTTSSSTVNHFYSQEGTYSVQLTVTDNEGATGFHFGVVPLCENPMELC